MAQIVLPIQVVVMKSCMLPNALALLCTVHLVVFPRSTLFWDRSARHTPTAHLSQSAQRERNEAFPSNLRTSPVIVSSFFLPCGLLLDWFSASSDFGHPQQHLSPTPPTPTKPFASLPTSCHFFTFSRVLIPRTAAGVPTLSSFPRTSCHFGLYEDRNVQERRIARKRNTDCGPKHTHTRFSVEAKTEPVPTDTTDSHESSSESNRKNSPLLAHETRRNQFRRSHRTARNARIFHNLTHISTRTDGEKHARAVSGTFATQCANYLLPCNFFVCFLPCLTPSTCSVSSNLIAFN